MSSPVTSKSAPRRQVATSSRNTGGGRKGPRKAGVGASRSVGKGGSAADRSLARKAVAGHITLEGITQFSSSAKDEFVTGADYLAPVTIPTTVTPGKVVKNILVTPTGIAARLATIATLWERYQFEYLELVYNPSVPTTTQGQIILTYDPDAVDLTPTEDARPFALATDDNITGPIYAPFSLVVRNLDHNTLYYTRDADAEDRFELQGQFYVVYSGTAPAAEFEAGTLSLRYRVRFSKRCYELAVPSALPPPADFTSWITTPLSVSAALKIFGTIYDTFGQTTSDAIKLGTKGILLKRGANLIRTVISGYPTGAATAAANTLVQTLLRRAADGKESVLKQSGTFGTVYRQLLSGGATSTDLSTTVESAVIQTGTVVGATNHFLSYCWIEVDSAGTYYLDAVLSTEGANATLITGYSIERLDGATWWRYVSPGLSNLVSKAVWSDPVPTPVLVSELGRTSGYELITPSGTTLAIAPPPTSTGGSGSTIIGRIFR